MSIIRYSLIAALALVCTTGVWAETIAGIVVGIADGDTVTLLNAQRQQNKIRLMGIDAPESHQPFGQKSKGQLSALAFNREVTADCGKTDKQNERRRCWTERARAWFYVVLHRPTAMCKFGPLMQHSGNHGSLIKPGKCLREVIEAGRRSYAAHTQND